MLEPVAIVAFEGPQVRDLRLELGAGRAELVDGDASARRHLGHELLVAPTSLHDQALGLSLGGSQHRGGLCRGDVEVLARARQSLRGLGSGCRQRRVGLLTGSQAGRVGLLAGCRQRRLRLIASARQRRLRLGPGRGQRR